MLNPSKDVFLEIWPKCFITFMAVIELACVLMLLLTELCSVGANFWTTNVFGGGWCGLIVFIHLISLVVAGTCAAGPPAAFRATIITFFALIACAALISFDIAFIIQPSTCILTPSCATNAASTTIFSYSFRQSFFTIFNSLDPFKSYTESQVKLLCQAIQLGLAAVCAIVCIIYLIIYFECLKRIKKQQQVGPSLPPKEQDYDHFPDNINSPMPTQQPNYGYSPPPVSPQQVYPAPQTPSRQMYMPFRPPPSQQVYAIPPPSQQVYMAPPPPQMLYYAPPPPPPPPFPPSTVRPLYYGGPPRQPSIPPWYARPHVPQPPPGVVPWNT